MCVLCNSYVMFTYENFRNSGPKGSASRADFSKLILLSEIFEKSEPFIHSTIFIECLLLLFLPACGGKVVGEAKKLPDELYILVGRERQK